MRTPLQSPIRFADSGEAANSALRYLVTVGTRVSAPSLIALRDISYVMECVRTGFVERTDLRALIHTIRGLPDPNLARQMKASLPYFLGSVCERFRANETVQRAHFAIFDLDHVPDIEAAKREALRHFPWLRWAFRSVRDGVKLLAQFDRPVTLEGEYRRLWRYLALQIERALDLPVDSTPDWSRACFFSFDPGLLYNSGFKPVDTALSLREEALLSEFARSAPSSANNACDSWTKSSLSTYSGTSPSDFDRAREIVLRLASRIIPYSDWIRAGMALYAGFGEAGRPLWDLFLDNPHYTDTPAELNRHWRSFARVHSIGLETLFYLGERYAQ